MFQRSGPPDGQPSAGADVVQLSTTADPSQLFVFRSLAAVLAARADFPREDIEDVRLAVDGMCAELLRRAADGEALTCRFEGETGSVGVVASVGADSDRPLTRHSLDWRVLAGTADQASTWSTMDDDMPVLHIGMTKTATTTVGSPSDQLVG